MRITIQYYTKPYGKFSINSVRKEEVIIGKTAAECMAEIRSRGAQHDISKFTPMEIINVED